MIDYILWIVNVIVNVIVILLPYLGGLSLLAIILVVSIPYLKKKISVSQIIKEHADALIGAVVIFILILPFILWKSGYYEENKLFANSDTLGYYGAVIGCTITVLGIHWTFNNEKVVAAEGRRNDSLPILKFELKNTYDVDKPYDLLVIREIDTYRKYKSLEKNEKKLYEELSNLRNKQGNILDKVRKQKNFEGYEMEFEDNIKSITKNQTDIDENSEKLAEIFFYGSTFFLNINNIGLQTAILSSISLCSKNGITSKVGVNHENSQKTKWAVENTAKIEKFAVTKEEELNLKIKFFYCDVLSNIKSKIEKKEYYDGGDYISIDFTDVYQNKYRYKLPIQLIKVNGKYSVHMVHKGVPVLPEIIEKSSS